MVRKGMFSVKWREIPVEEGHYINMAERRAHTPQKFSQKEECFCPLLRRGAVGPCNVPEKKKE